MADAVSQIEPLSPDKEAQILDGAALVFAADGYEGASMSRIAAGAGVSKGTLYNYFDGKAELFGAYVHRDCARRIAVWFDDLDPEAPPRETLRRIGRRMLDMLLSDAGLVMYRMVVAEAAKFPELARAFYAAGPARGLMRIAEWISRMADSGHLRVPDPQFAAEQLFALMQTDLCLKRRLLLIDGASDAEIDHVVDQAVHMFLLAYGA